MAMNPTWKQKMLYGKLRQEHGQLREQPGKSVWYDV